PFFAAFGIRRRLDWIVPEASYAQPLDGGRAAIAWRDLDRTAAGLGADGDAWRRLLGPLAARIQGVSDFTGSPLLRMPRDPLAAIRFGLRTLRVGNSAGPLRTEEAQALLTGVLAHANTRLPSVGAAAAGLMLAALAHTSGWGFPVGGAQAIPDALAADLGAHGGRIETGRRIDSLAGLDWGDPRRGDVLLLDASPRLALSHPDVPAGFARAILRY